jgi:hypothetical protein
MIPDADDDTIDVHDDEADTVEPADDDTGE